MSLNNNKADVVWVSSTLNKNRMCSSTKPDPLGDAGYESTTDDEGVTRNFPKAEVIVPQGNANSDQLAVSGSVVPFRSSPTSQYFCENMATAKRHVHTPVNSIKTGTLRGAEILKPRWRKLKLVL